MVVKLRLARWGVRNNPFYGVVAANARAPRDGRHLERVGTYNPIPDKDHVKHIELNYSRIKYWLGVGAQPTDRVAWLLAKAGLMPPTAIQLQRTGEHSLTDRKTWKVRISDSGGNSERVVSLDEARRLVAPDSKEKAFLDRIVSPPVPKAKELDRALIDFAKTPKTLLSEKERLLALKEYAGVY
ncbi:ribosomal protein S16 domain-containing protein [Obelidium mucronatum]|nr:ribosomal protein S16 domain-containing protein [Obelidium mucronatum]